MRVLVTGGPARRVLVGYQLYGLVEMAVWVAILLWAYDEGGAELAGLVAVVQLLPAALLAPPLATLGDRISRGTALALAQLGVALTTALTALLLLADAHPALVVAASTTSTIALAVVRPLHFAVLPQLARRPDDLVSANALSSISDGVSIFVGPVLAGLGAEVAGPALVFVIATGVALGATALCLRTGVAAPTGRSGAADGWLAVFRGLGPIARDRAVLMLLIVLVTKSVVDGAHDVLGVSLAVDGMGLGSTEAGLVVGALGLGGLIGGAVAATAARRPRLLGVLLASGVVQGVGIVLVALLAALAPVLAVLTLAGLGGTVLMVTGRTLLQRTSDPQNMARIFAVQEGTSLLGLAGGAALAPLLIELLSPYGAFVPLGLGAAGLTVLCVVFVRDLDRRAVYPVEVIELLRSVRFLSVLPAIELERLARTARWVDVAAGDHVVREGEQGDSFYVVDDGTLEVSVAGAVRPEHLHRGDGFGEIALLRSVPRTATVTAVSDARLVAIDSADFLAAVTGSADGKVLASEVAASHLARDSAAS